MTGLLWVLLLGGAAYGLSKRTRRLAREEPRVPPAAPATMSTVVVTPEPAPADSAERPGVSGPPGLLLRREPEIRGLPTEALGNYVSTVDRWIASGGIPTQAWWISRTQAAAEQLLRSRVRQPTGDLTDEQVSALVSWLVRLEEAGMPLSTNERALRINLSEEMNWRSEQRRTT